MEEFRQKLDFNSEQLWCKAIRSLCEQIEKRRHELVGTEDPITAATPQIKELELLWEKCGEGPSRLSSMCAHTLIELWESGVLDQDYVLQRFTNLLPTSRSVHACVEAVGKILLLLVKKAMYGVMQCGGEVVPESRHTFGMRISPHPFISMYKSRQDSWPSLLQQTAIMLAQDSDEFNAEVLHILKPFLKYVLLDPSTPPQQGSMRVLLSTCLGKSCRSDLSSTSDLLVFENQGKDGPVSLFAAEVADFLLDVLPALQINTRGAVTEAVHISTVALRLISSNSHSMKPNMVRCAAHHCLSLAHQQRELGMDMMSILRPLAEMELVYEHMVSTDGGVVFMLGDLLLKSSVGEKLALLEIVNKLRGAFASGQRVKTWRVLIWPLVQVISTLYGHSYIEVKSLEVSMRKEALQLASGILKDITDVDTLEQPDGETFEEELKPFGLNGWHGSMCAAGKTACRVMSNVNLARQWLQMLSAKLHAGNAGNALPEGAVQMVVALMYSFDFQLTETATLALVDICSPYPAEAFSVTPLFMYILNKKCNRPTEIMRHVLSALPKLANHRYLIPHILRLIYTHDLGPQSLRLVTDLWKKQDRVFPQLQQFIAEMQKKVGRRNPTLDIDEPLLAIAACIHEVCSLRPEQHGEDMMPSLSMVLKQASGPPGTPATLLALDALIAVIKAEVVDLHSVYKVLAQYLQKEDRPMVIAKYCEIFGLVPECHVDSTEYEVFSESVIRQLWHFTQHSDDRVVTAALSALAEFKTGDFDLNILPKKAAEEVVAKRAYERRKRRESIVARGGGEEEEEEEEEEEDLSVPGSCYIKLLSCVQDEAISGCQDLLHSFLCDELDDLPRRVFTQTSPRQGAAESGESKVIAEIPAALTQKSVDNKQPGLRPSFAAGLLFCYEPGSDKTRDGRAVRRNAIDRGKVWLNKLGQLLAEVPVSSADWLYLMQLPQAWCCFLSRAYQAVIEGRCADIEKLASRRGNGADEGRQKADMDAAWLWARDQFTEQLRTTVLKNSGARGNAILALAGLASVVSSHVIHLGEEATTTQRSATQYDGQRSWTTRVTDSLLAVIDPNHSPTAVFGWCTQSKEKEYSTATAAAQSCAILGLPLLVPHLLAMETTILSGVINRLLSSSPAHSPPSLHQGIGAGMLLARLCHEHYSDMMGSEGETMMMLAFQKLEMTAFENNNIDDHVTGCTLGLGIALTGLANEGATHAKVHLATVRGHLLNKINSAGDNLDVLMQARVFCASLVTAACYQVNRVTPQEALHTATVLQTLAQGNPKSVPLAVSVGLLVHCLASLGHSDVVMLFHNQHSVLRRQIDDTDSSSDAVKAAVAGLVCLLVGPGHLMWTDHTPETGHQKGKLAGVVKSLNQLLSDSSDLRLQHTLPWLLGYLHMGSSFVRERQSSVPSNYSYLSETSLMRAAVDFLLQAGQLGREVIPSQHVAAVLRALHDCCQSCDKGLPPLNWAVVLNPIIRNHTYDNGELYHPCMQLAIGQCGARQNPATQSTSNFIMSWMMPPKYQTIKESCTVLLLRSLPKLVNCISLKCLESFIMGQIVGLFQPDSPQQSYCVPALCGLKLALQIRDPPQGIVNLLSKAAKKIFESLPLETEYQCLLFSHLADCIKYLPWEDMDSMTSPLVENNLLKGTFTRAYLVRQSLQPPDWLMACVDEAMRSESASDRDAVLWFLLVAFSQASSSLPVREKISWLPKLMNFLKTVAFGRDSGAESSSIPPHEKMRLLLDVFAVTVVAWSSPPFSLLCGPHPQQYSNGTALQAPSQAASQSAACLDDSGDEGSLSSLCEADPDWLRQGNGNSPLGCGETGRRIVRDMKLFLPEALCQLVRVPPWDDMRAKIFDWLINICIDSTEEVVLPAMKTELKGCLYALRHYPEFRDKRWTRVFDS